jgi:hypothetical protein
MTDSPQDELRCRANSWKVQDMRGSAAVLRLAISPHLKAILPTVRQCPNGRASSMDLWQPQNGYMSKHGRSANGLASLVESLAHATQTAEQFEQKSVKNWKLWLRR